MANASSHVTDPPRETYPRIGLTIFAAGGDPEELLRAAGLVVGSTVLLDSEHAELTGCGCELVDYGDAGHAVAGSLSWEGRAQGN